MIWEVRHCASVGLGKDLRGFKKLGVSDIGI